MRTAETVLNIIRERFRNRLLESRGEIERLMPGSEGGRWKRALCAPRWRPTLPQARFLGGRGAAMRPSYPAGFTKSLNNENGNWGLLYH